MTNIRGHCRWGSVGFNDYKPPGRNKAQDLHSLLMRCTTESAGYAASLAIRKEAAAGGVGAGAGALGAGPGAGWSGEFGAGREASAGGSPRLPAWVAQVWPCGLLGYVCTKQCQSGASVRKVNDAIDAISDDNPDALLPQKQVAVGAHKNISSLCPITPSVGGTDSDFGIKIEGLLSQGSRTGRTFGDSTARN